LQVYAAGIMIVLSVRWFGIERRRFQGPPIGAQIGRRRSEIAAQERVVGEIS